MHSHEHMNGYVQDMKVHERADNMKFNNNGCFFYYHIAGWVCGVWMCVKLTTAGYEISVWYEQFVSIMFL